MQDNEITRVINNPFPQDSELYFPVAERRNAWLDKYDNAHVIDKEKSLVRLMDGEPHWLANVGENYKVVRNNELFLYVEERMLDMFEPEQLQDVVVNEHMAYSGRDCYREYIFKNVTCDIGHGGQVAFRLIVGNSYGSKAVSLLYGAIDFWCANGMIIGSHEKQVRKHTSGITLAGIDTWITEGVSHFLAHGSRMWGWNRSWIPMDDAKQMFEWLADNNTLSKQMGNLIYNNAQAERDKRVDTPIHVGDPIETMVNLWHIYSALTDWATHSDVRDTGNDHEANTRIERSKLVTRVMDKIETWYKHNEERLAV